MNDSMGEALGARLKLIRGHRSQRIFATELGLALTTYQNYERGERLPDAAMLARVAHQGWNAHWLLTGLGDERMQPVRADEDTTPYASRAIDPEIWDRAKRIVMFAVDAKNPKPGAPTIADAVAHTYNAIAGRPYDNNQLADLVQDAARRL